MKFLQYNLLFFKNLLDLAFIEFFKEYNDSFIKDGNCYRLAKDFNLQELEKFFCKQIIVQLDKLIKPYDVIYSPEIYFIIGACFPKNNYLLKFKDENFPSKLDAIISSKYSFKYILKEQDIKIDTIKFNEACLNVFNKFFIQQISKNRYNNVIFISNNQLDCYSMFKIIKCIYGRSNCKNLYSEYYSNIKSPIVAVNEIIDKHIKNKVIANHDIQFKKIYHEIKQFLDLRISQIRG